MIGGANHPAVVVYAEVDRFTVIYGTGTVRPITPLTVVEPHTRYGKALRLTKVTHFYGTNVRVVTVGVLSSRFLKCPPGLFTELRTLTDAMLMTLGANVRSQGVASAPPAATTLSSDSSE